MLVLLSEGMRSFAFCLLVLIWGGIPRQGHAEDRREDLIVEVENLETLLRDNPRDVDSRLKLAYCLSWIDRPKEARRHALLIVKEAPEYWDAHVLLARLDAWKADYTASRQRLETILAKVPQHREALLVRADVALWSKEYAEAEATLKALIELDPSADLYYRLAQVSVSRKRPYEARGYASEALRLDPKHTRAQEIRDSVHYVTLYVTSQSEYFPSIKAEGRFAYSQTLVLSLIPVASVGVALTYDFHRRFATYNHRFGGRINLRASEKLHVSAFLRGGSVKVLPKWSADLGVALKLSPGLMAGARYNLDTMTWPGRLHRASVSIGAQVHKSTYFEGEYFGGIMRHCGESDFVQGAALKAQWARERLQFGASYAFGTELERPPLRGYLDGRLGSTFCLDELGGELQGSPLDLAETRAHSIGSTAGYQITSSTLALAGYALQLRFDGTEVHVFHLSLQQSI